VLTKPLGTGILATALKAGELEENTVLQITEIMAALNRDAAEAMAEVGVNACTDVTGFGLLRHCLEMAKASNVGIQLWAKKVPVISEAKIFASMGFVPGGSFNNQNFCANHLEIDPSLDPILLDLFSDPQTSGGLLISVPERKASALVQNLRERNTPSAHIIGEVLENRPGIIKVH